MKSLLFLLFSFLGIQAFGQISEINTNSFVNKYSQLNDTLPQVVYKNNPFSHKDVAWFVNDLFVGQSGMTALNPDLIATLNVEKKDIEIDNINYYGKVNITMKENYHPKFISLNELKSKYTNLKDSSVLFIIENDIIRGDYAKCMVDENYLLQIVVDKVDLKAEKMNFHLVKLLTRTPENIKKTKEIRIRGANEPGKN
ncbi:MAG: hypothetical protein WCI31_00360 [Prolixibacteraceae bacterium]